jgi:outer membrane protein insertion porin family
MGLRPSIFLDVGSLFDITQPVLQDYPNGLQATDGSGNLLFVQSGVGADGNPTVELVTSPVAPDGTVNPPSIIGGTYFREVFVGDSPSPRISVGVGVNWNSPFGPFRIDVAHVLKKQVGDDTKVFTFNVGTQF